MTKILDTTLRDGLMNPDYKLGESEKAAIVRDLDLSSIEIIEITHINNASDLDSIVSLSKEAHNAEICVLSDCKISNIELSIKALDKAKLPRLHLYSMANVTDDELDHTLEIIEEAVSFASKYVTHVQWTGFDGNSAPYKVFIRQIEQAIEKGAKIISIPDSLGVSTPAEFQHLINGIIKDVPRIGSVELSVHCHNDLGYAYENSCVAVDLGIDQVECALLGIGARKGNCNTLNFSNHLNTKKKGQYNVDKIAEAEEILKSAMVKQ
jgi:2-isopropylmalate synthase